MDKRVEKILKLIRLCDTDRIRAYVTTHEVPPPISGTTETFYHIETDDYEPSELFSLSSEGRVVRTTVQYSGHNGDAYGYESALMPQDLADEKLDRLTTKLTRMAVNAEDRRQTAEREKAAKSAREALLEAAVLQRLESIELDEKTGKK